MKDKFMLIILALASAIALCACGEGAGMKEYKSRDGWTVSYDKKLFNVNEGNGVVDFVYTGESAGTNMVEISFIPDKQPEEALAEITDTWGEDANISRTEGFFPGTNDKWGYWRTLDTPNEGSGLGETLIAGEYNGGVLLFEIISHGSNYDDTTVSDELSGIIDSITYENFGTQTMYDYIPGTYTMQMNDELDGQAVSAEYSVTLNEDHTGVVSMQDDVDVIWGSYELTYASGNGSYEYDIEGDNLMLNLDGVWTTFERKK